MRKELYYWLLGLFCLANLTHLSGQRVTSSCELEPGITDSLLTLDAERIAFQNYLQQQQESTINSIDSALWSATTETIYRALAAVYNAEAIPARKDIFATYNIHALALDVHRIELWVDDQNTWLNAVLEDSKTSVPALDALIEQHGLVAEESFIQTNGGQVLRLWSQQALNFYELEADFERIQSVRDARPVYLGEDLSKNITFEQKADHVELTFRYSWGSCETICAFDHFWRFEIYDDCSVQFIENFGTPLAVANLERLIEVSLFPNPSADLVNISLLGPTRKVLLMSLHDARGQLLQSMELNANDGHFSTQLSLYELPIGVYFLSFQDDSSILTEKLFKR
ncbi:MAG: T9SS type A sorting domain-containing protein [Bacteroidota bacterium]